MVKSIIKYCDVCDNEVDTKVISIEEDYTVENEVLRVQTIARICTICSNPIYDEELDQNTMKKVFDAYRNKHSLLLPEQIKGIREMYGLSQRAFAKLLNWGDRTILRYENGSLQDKAHNALLVFLKEPRNMADYIIKNETGLDDKKIKELKERVDLLVHDSKKHNLTQCVLDLFSDDKETIYNGFKVFDFEKFYNAILFFTQKSNILFKVKLMKLLFYSDFTYYRDYSTSILGVRYAHLPYGPVPKEHDLLLESLNKEGIINIKKSIYEGYESFEIEGLIKYDESIFTKEELMTLNRVFEKFRDFGSKEISDISHKEKGYLETSDYQEIPYDYSRYITVV